jgi:NDP-sugar pyrophosphorylase family protein
MNIIPSQRIGLLILAGGRATRMQPSLNGRPKALLTIPPWRSVLLDLVSRARRLSMEVCVAVDAGTYADIASYLTYHNQKVDYSVDGGFGTAAAITAAVEGMRAPFILVCNADTIIPVDILQLSLNIRQYRPFLQMLAPNSTQNSGLIGVADDRLGGRVAHWGEHIAIPPSRRLVAASSSGAYIINRKYWLNDVDLCAKSLERDIMPVVVSTGSVGAFVVNSSLPVFDYGTIKRFRLLEANPGLLQRLFGAFGAESEPSSGYSLDEVRIA